MYLDTPHTAAGYLALKGVVNKYTFMVWFYFQVFSVLVKLGLSFCLYFYLVFIHLHHNIEHSRQLRKTNAFNYSRDIQRYHAFLAVQSIFTVKNEANLVFDNKRVHVRLTRIT